MKYYINQHKYLKVSHNILRKCVHHKYMKSLYICSNNFVSLQQRRHRLNKFKQNKCLASGDDNKSIDFIKDEGKIFTLII